MDIAVVGAGVSLTLDESGICQSARIALGAEAPTVVVVESGAEALIGSRLDDDALGKLKAAASAACKPIDDKPTGFVVKINGEIEAFLPFTL